MRRPLLAAAPVAVAVILTGWLAYEWSRPGPSRTPGEASFTEDEGRAGTPGDRSPEEMLAQITWTDIGRTLEQTNSRPSLRPRLIEAAATSTRAEARYLRGLLLLASERREDALAAFGSIPPDAIPATDLYAPYRLHEVLRPGAANPYRPGLLAGRAAGLLTPIVDARIAVEQSDLTGALRAYMRTDPAQWARHDLVSFRMLRMHAGLARETTALIAAALRAGRVRPDLRIELAQVATDADADATRARQQRALADLLRRNPKARATALQAAEAQLRARQLFLAHRYRELVNEYRSNDPVTLPDGTLLLLYLSASRLDDRSATERWGQEVVRRHPEREVREWIQNLRVERP